jgi:hypothetical protein
MIESNERTDVSAPNYNQYDLGSGPRDRTLRVGDKERDAVSDILRQRHVEGRLDADEFHARLDRCLAAKTYAELDELIADLPREEARPGRRGQSRTWRPWPFPVLLLPIALIAAIASGVHLAWLALPLVFFFFVRPLLWRTSGGYGRGYWACGPRRTTRG